MIPIIEDIKSNSLLSQFSQDIQNLESDIQQVVNSYGGSISAEQAFELLMPVLGRRNPAASVAIDVAKGNITPNQAREVLRVVNAAKQDLQPVPANPALITAQRNLQAELAKPVGQPEYVEGRGFIGNTSDFQDADKIAQYREAVSRNQAIQDKREATRDERQAKITADLQSISSIVPNTILGQTGVISDGNIDISSAKIDPIMRQGAISTGGTGQGLGQQVEQNVLSLGGQAQQAAQQAGQQQQQAASGLPTELTNIPVDNDYSMDEAAIVENLIRSGRISTQQVSDYFNLPVSEINSVLEQSFGYTPQQISQVATPVSVALSGVVKDNNYSMEDAAIVENAIRTGQVTIQDVSDYFGLPVADINRVLTTDFGYTPAQISSAGGGEVTSQQAAQQAAQQTAQQTAQTTTGATTGAATTGTTGNIFSGMNTAEDQARARQLGLTPLQYAQAGGLGANVDMNAIQAAQGVGQDLSGITGLQGYTGGTVQGGNIRYQDPNVIGGMVNMPQTGVIGAEAALQGGLTGGLAGLQEGLATGATGLTGAVASGLQELRRALGQGRQDITAGYGRAEAGFQPYMAGGEAAQAQLEALTGARGQEAFQQAYQESPYIQFLREQGMRANLAGAAATGGLGGGNVQRELARFGQGLASQGLQQQIQNLQALTGQGLQAAQGAGGYASGGAGQLAGLAQTQGTQALGAMQNVGQQLANLGIIGGQTAAEMGYGTGQRLADIRTRAGELLAGEISDVSRDVSGLAAGLGGDISGVYATQSKNLADLLTQSGMAQADATRIAASLLSNIATGSGSQVAGLGTSVGQPQQTQGILGQVGQAASGIGTAAAGLSLLSDIRAKENIIKIGQLPSGLGLYSWDWKASAPSDAKGNPTVGVIAQEVQLLMPEAIIQREDGYMAVDYSKVN